MGIVQIRFSIVIAALATTSSFARAQAPAGTTLEQQLESKYALTTPTADNSDIVTTGAVLILQKKGFSAGAVSSKVATQNTYKDGQIRTGAATAVRRFGGLPGVSLVPGVGSVAGSAAGAAGGSRDFVNGEKLYVTRITVDRGKDAVSFDLISDAYGDAGRYKASLRFEFPRKTLASADLSTVDPTIAQVFQIAPADQNASASQGGQPAAAEPAPAAAAAAPAPAAPAMAPIAPPPPPPPDPKSISIGQTTDEVVAAMGQPEKIVKLGTKAIYYYKDMKVTFVNGKMTDAQ